MAEGRRVLRGLPLRWIHGVVCFLLVFFSLVQRPGETTFDTKLDLAVDPSGFLARSMHLWNPQANFGELQNQAYGYLFPQGTFFVLGEYANLAPWVVQRLWSALLLVLAYEGARRLWRAVTDDRSVLVGLAVGLAYSLSPRLVGLDGTLTGEVLPTAVLPWMVLPLVHARRGRLAPMTAGLLAGAALLFCGGLNAVENLAVLPLPFLLVMSGLRQTGGFRLLVWWAGATALASLWWILPLFVMGAYSPPFLDYIETSSTTTNVLGWFNVLRGANHWVGFLTTGHDPVWPASLALSTSDFGIAVTALAVVPMVWGLFHRGLPWRGVWVGSFLLGAVCLVVAHVSPIGSPLATTMRELLDGPLAPFRNVHKVDPLMRLPLALGAGVAVRAMLDHVRAPRWVRMRAVTGISLTLALIILGGYPMFLGDMRRAGWKEIPQAWTDAAAYVDEHHSGGRVLVLPGSGFAHQTWGITVDEPIQALSSAPWVSRSQVPLVPGPTIRMLDAIGERINKGVGSPALGATLARAGITLVIVRRDLDITSTEAPPPNRVDMAIEGSSGLIKVAEFGATTVGGQPLIDVFRVDEYVRPLEVSAKNQIPGVAGDTGDVMAGLEAGLLPEDSMVLFHKDASNLSPDVQSDGYRLVQRQFGRVYDAAGATMGPRDPLSRGTVARDYPGVAGEEPAYVDAGQVSAMETSPSSTYAANLSGVESLGPYAAVDGDPTTAWVSSPYADPEDAWLKMTFERPRALRLVTARFASGLGFARVRKVRFIADGVSRTAEVDPGTGLAVAELGARGTKTLRIAIESVWPRQGILVGLREVTASTLEVSQRIVVPAAGADERTSFLFNGRTPRGACTPTEGGPVCDESMIRGGGSNVLERGFTVDTGSEYVLRGQAVARAVPATAGLAHPLSRRQVALDSDSVFTDDPLVLPQFAYDGDQTTAWFAERGDSSPVLKLKWRGKRTLDRISVMPPAHAIGPTRLTLTAGEETREVRLSGFLADGRFEPLRTDELEITVHRPDLAPHEHLGVAELNIEGLNARRAIYNPDARTGTLCGFGPEIDFNGTKIPTKVTGRMADVMAGRPVSYEACSDPVEVSAGGQEISVAATDQFLPVSAELIATRGREFSRPTRRTASVLQWDATLRRVRVAPGQQSVLRIPENENAGWVATLDGEPLVKVTPDGWQQGYVVPSGEGGVITLTFTPDNTYRMALATGLGAALLVILGAGVGLWSERRRRRRVIPVVVPDPRPRRRPWLGLLGLAVGAGVLGGFAPALGVAASALVRRHLVVTVVALVTGAVVMALAQLPSWIPAWSPDLLAGMAVGALVGALVGTREEPA